jgi:hypothetical protein
MHYVEARERATKARTVTVCTASTLAQLQTTHEVLESHIYAVQAAPIHDGAALVAALSAQARALAVVNPDANSNAFFDTSLLAVAPAPGCCVRRALGSRKDVVHQRLESREDREQREQAVGGVDTVSSAGKPASSHGKPKIVKHLSDSKAIEAFFAKPTTDAAAATTADAATTTPAADATAVTTVAAASTAAPLEDSSPSSSKRSAPVKKAKSGPMAAFFKASTAKTPVESKPVVQAVVAEVAEFAEAHLDKSIADEPELLRTEVLKETIAAVEQKRESQQQASSEVVVDDPSSAKKRLRRRQVVESDDEEEPAGVSSSLPTMSRSASIMTQDSTSASAQAKRRNTITDDSDDEVPNNDDEDDVEADDEAEDDDNEEKKEDGDKAASTTTKKEKKPKKPKAPTDPNRPKRPANAFFLYRNDNLERVKSENADLGAKEIDKKLRDDWAADADAKKVYGDKSKAAIAAWKTAADAYDAAANAKTASKGDSQNEEEVDEAPAADTDSESSEERARVRRQKRLPKDQLTLEHFSPKKPVTKRRRTKIVIETFADEQGYFVQREVVVTDSEASEEKPSTPKPSAASSSSASSALAALGKKTAAAKADDASKSASGSSKPGKQSNLASFFGKK